MTGRGQAKPAGWADDRLMQAYDLIYAVQQDGKNLGINQAFEKVLGKIEDLDTTLSEAVLEGVPDDVAGSTLRKQAEHARKPWHEPRSWEDRDAHGLRVHGLTEGDLP